jgi:hypothetical protein
MSAAPAANEGWPYPTANEGWPYRGDHLITILRRVALAYRQRLLQVSPATCAAMDEEMRRFGQHWVIPRPVSADPADPGAWIAAADAAELAGISMSTLRGLRYRKLVTGRKRKHRRPGEQGNPGWEYQVGEIMALATTPRTRKRGTDQ